MNRETFTPPEVRSNEMLVNQNIAKMEELMENKFTDEGGNLGLGSGNIAGESHAREVITAYLDKDSGELIDFGRKDQVHESVRKYPTMNIFSIRNLPEDKGFGKRSFIEKAATSGELSQPADKVITDTIASYNIGNAENFEGLYAILEAMGEVKSSDGTAYTADKLINWISGVSSGETRLDSITRSGGLRNKVEELLEKFAVIK